MKKSKVREALHPYLNRLQIEMCWSRIKTLKAAIDKMLAMKPEFLLGEEDWSEATMEEELSGRYGRTYLDIFVNYEEYNKAFVAYNHEVPI